LRYLEDVPGVGKTLLAEQLAVATVLGAEWLGVVPERGRALLVCCEDDEDEMHIRFGNIASFYGASFADLRNDLFPISLVGLETIAAEPDRMGQIRPTALYHRILRLAQDIKPALIHSWFQSIKLQPISKGHVRSLMRRRGCSSGLPPRGRPRRRYQTVLPPWYGNLASLIHLPSTPPSVPAATARATSKRRSKANMTKWFARRKAGATRN